MSDRVNKMVLHPDLYVTITDIHTAFYKKTGSIFLPFPAER